MSKITSLSDDGNGKVEVYADGEYLMTLTQDAVIEAGIKPGMTADEQTLAEIQTAVSLVKARNKAYLYLSYGDMSEKTLGDKLRHAGFSEEISALCIAEMKQRGYIDDIRYANSLAEVCVNTKLYGRQRAEAELVRKGIEPSLARETLDGIDADYLENAIKLANGKFRHNNKDRRERQKTVNALIRYGYDYDTVNAALGDTEDEYE